MSSFTDALTNSLKERGMTMSSIANNLPAGAYEGTIFSQRFYENDNGTPIFEVGFENLVRTDDPDSFSPISGDTHRYVRMPLTDRAQKWTLRKLKFLGFEGAPSQFNPDGPDHRSIIGGTKPLYMQIGSYGEDWDINVPKDNGPMETVKAKQWDARFSHLMPFKPLEGSNPTEPPTGGASSFGS